MDWYQYKKHFLVFLVCRVSAAWITTKNLLDELSSQNKSFLMEILVGEITLVETGENEYDYRDKSKIKNQPPQKVMLSIMTLMEEIKLILFEK